MTDKTEDKPVPGIPIPEPVDKAALLASSCLKGFDPLNTKELPPECTLMKVDPGEPGDGLVEITVVIDFKKTKGDV